MQRQWCERAFVFVTLLLGLLYVSYPQRRTQWTNAWEGWQTSVGPEPQPAVGEDFLAKLNYAETEYTALADFDELEYLGCIQYGDNDGDWLIAYWRTGSDKIQDTSVHVRLAHPTLKTMIETKREIVWENDLGWTAIPLDRPYVEGGQVWIALSSTSSSEKILVTSTALLTSQGSELLIWER